MEDKQRLNGHLHLIICSSFARLKMQKSCIITSHLETPHTHTTLNKPSSVPDTDMRIILNLNDFLDSACDYQFFEALFDMHPHY